MLSTKGGMGDERYSPTQPFSVGMPSFTPPTPTEQSTWGATPIDQLTKRLGYQPDPAASIKEARALMAAAGYPVGL